jgi:D-alanyl-D-alanine carboxypeptidase (penicillin-binding protein 5/6)
MASGNDAAYALAEAGGGREATLAAMNERARYLGAHDTVAKDPAGLDVEGQTSSAYDLALIGRAALQDPALRGYVATKQVDFPGRVDPKTTKRETYKVNNHNRLLYNYEGTIGLKNGYTEAAHRTFISAVTRGGRTYLLTEMYGLDGSWRPQAAMYDWAFAHGDRATPIGELVAPGTVTTPPVLAPTSPPTLIGSAPPAVAGPSTSPTTAAAAALPHLALLSGKGAPWVGVVSLAAIAVLLLALSAGVRRRRRRSQH